MYVNWLQFSDTVKAELMEQISKEFDGINNPSMKEVRGLEDRLYGLEQLMFGARKLVQEQGDMSQVMFIFWEFINSTAE